VRTEDELRRLLSDAAQRAAGPSPDARARVGRVVRRQRAWRVGAVAGVAIALAAFGIVTITRPQHQASVRVVSPGPSPSPSAVPGPEPDTAPSAPSTQSEFVPAGFSAASITFVSPKDGFVLGSAPCATAQCTVILRTTDTGKTWHRIGAPPAQVTQPGGGPLDISELRFATDKDGWAFGPGLWSTHDGGDHWTRVAHNGDVRDLEASAGTAHMVVLTPPPDPDHQYEYRILSTPVSRDTWVASPTAIVKGAAPVADAQLVLQHRSGWLLINERVVYGGARLTPTGWVSWKPPCTEAMGPATLVAPTPTNLFAVCWEGVWGQPPSPGTGLYVSADAGTTFKRAHASVPGNGGQPASPDPSTVVVADGAADGKPELLATFDSGATWSVVYHGAVEALGFTSPTQGIGLEVGSNAGGYPQLTRFVLTTDGGHHWKSTPFGPVANPSRRCATSDLTLSMGEPILQGSSQQQTLTLGLTNTSNSACYMQGYPGVAFATPDGASIPFLYERTGDAVVTSAPPTRVPLGAGDTAWITLNKTDCQVAGKTSATAVHVIPPDERDALSLELPQEATVFAPCDPGEPSATIHISPVEATPQETRRSN
jgi:hypothetical protein